MADLDVARLRELLEKATPCPWTAARSDHGIVQFTTQTANRTDGPTWVAWAHDGDADPDDQFLVTAMTGDGPAAENNADLIAEAINALPALLDRLERGERALELVRRARQLKADGGWTRPSDWAEWIAVVDALLSEEDA